MHNLFRCSRNILNSITFSFFHYSDLLFKIHSTVCCLYSFYLKSQKRIPWNANNMARRIQSLLVCNSPISCCCRSDRCSTTSWPWRADSLSICSFWACSNGWRAFCSGEPPALPTLPASSSSVKIKIWFSFKRHIIWSLRWFYRLFSILFASLSKPGRGKYVHTIETALTFRISLCQYN